jgi:hypothetical protein
VKGRDLLEDLCQERDNTAVEGTGREVVGLFKNMDSWRFLVKTLVILGVP